MNDLHVLYRCFDADGELLYIGITNDPPRRFRHHAEKTFWWGDVTNLKLDTNFASRYDLELAERAAILAEIPLHNSDHNDNWHTKHKALPCSQEVVDAMEMLGELLMPRADYPECETEEAS